MGFSNENISLGLPAVALVAYDMSLTTPLPAIALTAGFGASVRATLPSPTLSTDFKPTPTIVVKATLPAVGVSAQVLSGRVATLGKTLPAVKLTISKVKGGAVSFSVPALTLTASFSPQIAWNAALNLPAVELLASILAEIDPTDTDYVVWVVNAETGVHTKYTSWGANSHGLFNDVELIALEDGLYEITGTDDAGVYIDARLYWVPTDMGSPQQKRLEHALINSRHDNGSYRLATISDETVQLNYDFHNSMRKEGIDRRRILLAKGLQAQKWQFGYENRSGATFDLEEITIPAIPSTRKTR